MGNAHIHIHIYIYVYIGTSTSRSVKRNGKSLSNKKWLLFLPTSFVRSCFRAENVNEFFRDKCRKACRFRLHVKWYLKFPMVQKILIKKSKSDVT
jgi:hypothetical protein